MAKFVEDELLDETSETPTPVKATSKETAKVTAAAPSASEESEEASDEVADEQPKASSASTDEDTDWGDKKTMDYSDGLDRLRPDKGQGVRFAILGATDASDYFAGFKPKKALTHYIDKKGTYLCLAAEDEPGVCCKKLAEDPSMTIVALVLAYTNADKNGKYLADGNNKLPPVEWKIMYVQLGRANFRDISELPEEDKTVYDIDIIMSHKNGAKGGGYKFTVGSSSARWKKNAKLVEEVKLATKKFQDGKKLSKKLGRRVTAKEMKTMLATLTAGTDDETLEGIENI